MPNKFFKTLIFVIFSLSGVQGQTVFSTDSLLSERKQKDSLFILGENSPLSAESIATFGGLNYFEPDSSFFTIGRLHRMEIPESFEMETSTDRRPEYNKFGFIVFSLHEQLCTLWVYRNDEIASKSGYEKYLFLPFTDLTNGDSTYGGGRYLDLEIPDGDFLVIDFNQSYNPYCAYNDRYSCPIPPPENHLELKILAGEKYPYQRKH